MGAQLSQHLDQGLEDSSIFKRAVKATFSQFAKRGLPGSAEALSLEDTGPEIALQRQQQHFEREGGWDAAESDARSSLGAAADESSLPGVAHEHLLDAAKALIKLLGESMDERLSRVCLRGPTKRDCEYVLFSDSQLRALDPAKGPLHLNDFERFQRGIVKRVAVDRGRRLLVFMAGGLLAVHLVKRTLRKVPLVGPPVIALVSLVLPTSVVGPAVGVAGALYIDNASANRQP